MSIIYEALKKVQTQMHTDTGSPAEQAQPIVVDIKPEKLQQPVFFQDEPENKSLFRFVMPFAIVIFTGIVWMVATIIYYSEPMQRWLHMTQPAPTLYAPPAPANPSLPTALAPVSEPQAAPVAEPAPAPEAVAQPIQVPVAQPQAEPAAATQAAPAPAIVATGVADGLQPAAQRAEAAQPAPAAAASTTEPVTLHVQGIMTQNGQSVVLINDRIYEAGDTLGDIKILNITSDTLKILRDGKEENILLRR